MHKTFAAVILSATLTFAQSQPTAAELLQKGIYAQETAGDLDGAIKIYHQIVDSHPTQREIAAQAQYRLGITLLEKGDAAAASQEIQRLGWDFPDYKDLIAASKTAGGATRSPFNYVFEMNLKEAEAQDLAKLTAQKANHDAEFDFADTATLTGTVKQVQMMNPYAWLTVALADSILPPIRVSLASPNTLASGGWNRETVKLGDQITITGAMALDGSLTMQATSVSHNGTVLFTRSATATK